MIRDDVVKKLVETGKWSETTAKLAERAGYKCEYCGLDLLGSVEAYKQFEVDHIVPISRKGNPQDFDNLAVSCRHCNFHLKRFWNPSAVAGESASRDELIAAARQYLDDPRGKFADDLDVVRKIVGWTPDEQRHCE